MIEYLKFHLAKVLAEAGIGLLILLLMCSPLIWLALKQAWRQFRCKHPTFYENRRCHAICSKCSKDLGFIQNWRADKTRREL
jgi:hypothetical protein